jgi:hypothetical protein
MITFHRNFPAGLVPGRVIKADKREPIALTSVRRPRTAKLSLSARTFLATSKIVALEEQTPRQASIAADNILALLDTDSDKGLAMLRSSSPLTAAIVRSYLEEDLPESFRIFNPALVARVERVRAKFQK